VPLDPIGEPVAVRRGEEGGRRDREEEDDEELERSLQLLIVESR